MIVSSEAINLLGRAGLDLLTLLVLVGVLYRSQQALPSMPLIFTTLNVGIFATVTAFTSTAGVITAGIGFGLFAILQMIRLRSTAFTVKDVAYTFLVLIIGLINALPGLSWQMLILLNLALILSVAVTDTTRNARVSRAMTMTLDKAVSNPTEVRALLEERLGFAVESVVIRDIDLVRDTTQLRLTYFADAAWGRSTSEALAEELDGIFR